MALPDKLPKPAKHPEHITEADWEKYFADRKKYDRPLTEEETMNFLKGGYKCMQNNDNEGFLRCVRQTITAECALAHKSVFGLMSLSEYNLYEAKKEYPDEF